MWGSTAFIKMVRDGKELFTDLKETIIGLDQEGYSAFKIAEFLSLNLRTVFYIIKRYLERGTVEILPRSGRKKKTNARTDRLLLRMVKTNRRQTSKFNNSTPYKLSKRTVQRRLHDAGFKRRRIAKSITIRGVNRGKRRAFCRSKYHWNVRSLVKNHLFRWSASCYICVMSLTWNLYASMLRAVWWPGSSVGCVCGVLGLHCLQRCWKTCTSRRKYEFREEYKCAGWMFMASCYKTFSYGPLDTTGQRAMSVLRTDHPVEKRQPHSHSFLATTEPWSQYHRKCLADT